MLRPGDAAPPFVARPIFGLEQPVPPPAGARPVVLCFVRDLASPFTRAAMAAIQARFADFDREGFPLVVVTAARDFGPRFHVLAPLVVDQDGSLHERYQVPRDRMLAGTLRRLAQPAALRGAFDALQHGHGKPHRAVDRLSASFVIGADGRVALASYATSITDLPDLDALLQCARGL
jgi:peroxiredoxin